MNFVVFLDVDGVLNSAQDGFSIDLKTDKHLKLLEQLVKETNSNIVLSSSWRDKVYEVINTGVSSINPDANKLAELFRKYNIEVIGCTNHSFDRDRLKEILDWLSRNEDNIEDFIILDDEWEDLKLLTNKLILTSDATPNRPILGCWYCRDGLRFIHVIKSIKMLGIKNIKRRNNQNEQS